MKHHRDVMADAFGIENLPQAAGLNPMEGLSNLADCMLVLACGLMIALVVHWNLNMAPKYAPVEETGAMVEVEGDITEAYQSESESTESSEQSSYREMGTLYQDESTGKMYYLQETEK